MLLPTALSFMYQSIHTSTPPLFFILRFTAIKNSTDLWVKFFLVHTPNLQRYRLTRGGNNISDSSLEGNKPAAQAAGADPPPMKLHQ